MFQRLGIRHLVFAGLLAVFSAAFIVSTLAYFSHFRDTLDETQSREAHQLSRYILTDLAQAAAIQDRLLATMVADPDIALAVDTDPFSRQLGAKLAERRIQDLLTRHPFLVAATVREDNAPVLTILAADRPASDLGDPARLTHRTTTIPGGGTLDLTADPVRQIQDHLAAHDLLPELRIHYRRGDAAWLIDRDRAVPTDLMPPRDAPTRQVIDGMAYLVSPAAGADGTAIATLMPQATLDAALDDVFNQALITLVIASVVVFLLARQVTRAVTRPLHRLEAAAKRLMEGDFTTIPIDGHDETRPALEAFNAMSRRIQGFTEELQRTVAERTAELEELHNTDALTGLRNRHYLHHCLPAVVDDARARNLPLGLAMLDLDHFKSINDRHGHGAGDLCLIHAAALLRTTFPDAHILRLGGEELGVVAVDWSVESFRLRLGSYRQALAATTVHPDAETAIAMTISIGAVHRVPEPDDSLESLMQDADTALYDAKAAGRNRLRMADQPRIEVVG